MRKKVALVSGGNRGLGWEVCRQLATAGVQVVLGARRPADGIRAAERLRESHGLRVAPVELDVRRSEGIRRAVRFAVRRFGRLDILVNNAAVLPEDTAVGGGSVLNVSAETVGAAFRTNALGPLLLCQAVVPDMLARGEGRIVNVSTADAQLCRMQGGRAAYRLSKVALNAVTLMLAAELRGTNVHVNSVCPGWMNTRMGGPEAKRTAAQGAETVVWLALQGADGPSGRFFRDQRPIPW